MARWSESKRPARAHARTAHWREWHGEFALAFSATVTPSRTRARDLPVLASLPILALLPSRAKVLPFRTGPKGISLFGDGFLRQTRGERSMT